MMKKGSLILLFIATLFNSMGQDSMISLDLENVKINVLVNAIESQTDLYFYYDIQEFDSLSFSIAIKNNSINEVLSQVFENSDIHFTLDENSNIFLTKGRSLNFRIAYLAQNSFQTDSFPNTPSTQDILAIWENKLYEIGDKSNSNLEGPFTISGIISVSETHEPMIGTSIFIIEPRIGISTDQNGFYQLTLPKGRHTLRIQSVGMKDTRRQISLNGNGTFNIEVIQTGLELDEILIVAQKESNINSTQMGLQKIDIKTIKQVPVVFGEADILKVITTLPGVKTIGEASTGLNVRGGAADQNLILFNDAPIFNPSHFFGMFSAFNSEIVQDVELYKGSIPARYGGRLSSVLNINSREGNSEKVTGSAGIGLLTSRLNIEAPLNHGKTTILAAGRTTYSNWLLNKLPEPYKGSKATFYDLNLKVIHKFNDNNKVSFSGYLSHDEFNLNSDTLFSYGNKNLSVKWEHKFNDNFSGSISSGLTNYEYQINSQSYPPTAFKLGFNINQAFLNAHFDYYISPKHSLNFGLNTLQYKLSPGSYLPFSDESLVVADQIETEKALESALYISDAFRVTDKLSIDLGIRLSLYNYLGPHNVNVYKPNLPLKESNLISSELQNGILKTYAAPEYRASVRYAFNNNFSLKAAYNTQHQYIHSISNTATASPTDVWKLSDNNIKPQSGDQISFGVYNNFKSNLIETSVEVYYKNIKNYLDYKSGAQLIMNHHLETDVIATKGKAYGVEILIKKLKGKFNGWISYTWSRILLKQDDPLAGELINKGEYYPANYDKPHDITIVSNYRFTKRFSASINATYSTGRPLTLPVGVYNYGGSVRTLYLERNAYRIPDYFRADLSLNIDGNHKVTQKVHSSWTLGVYNFTGRNNPYSVYYVSENGKTQGYKLSIFGSAIPFINLNLRF